MFGRFSAASLISGTPNALALAKFKAKYPGPFMSDDAFHNLLARTRKMRRGTTRNALRVLPVGMR